MRRLTAPTASLLLVLAAAACVRAPGAAPIEPIAPVAPVAPVAPIAPVAPTPVSGVAGLQERQPDTCGASKFPQAVGQPASAIPSLGVTREYRVVEFRGIEPQDYDPLRMVFRLDQGGIIQKVDCG